MFENEITRTFIQTNEFSRQWEKLGLDDEDLRRLELAIMHNPKIGVVMQGTGGLRKMRFAFEGRGKSGSTRVCCVDFAVFDTVYLITAFGKNQKENLTKEECNNIRKAMNFLRAEVSELGGGKQDE